MSLPVFQEFVLAYFNEERKTEAVKLSHPAPESFVFQYTDSEEFMFGHHRFSYDKYLSEALSKDTGIVSCVTKRKRDELEGHATWYVVQATEEGFLVINFSQAETRIEYEYTELRRREGWEFMVKKSLEGSFRALKEAYLAQLFETPAYRLLALTEEIKVIKLT